MGSWESVVREVRSLIEAEAGPPELSTNLWDQGNLPLVRILINSELKGLQSYNNVCNQVLDASFYGNKLLRQSSSLRHLCVLVLTWHWWLTEKKMMDYGIWIRDIARLNPAGSIVLTC
ncbi:hypothetical protein Peur_017694 [Populus x canadensis]